MRVEVLGFDDMKCLYGIDLDFVESWRACEEQTLSDNWTDYFIIEYIFFKGI